MRVSYAAALGNLGTAAVATFVTTGLPVDTPHALFIVLQLVAFGERVHHTRQYRHAPGPAGGLGRVIARLAFGNALSGGAWGLLLWHTTADLQGFASVFPLVVTPFVCVAAVAAYAAVWPVFEAFLAALVLVAVPGHIHNHGVEAWSGVLLLLILAAFLLWAGRLYRVTCVTAVSRDIGAQRLVQELQQANRSLAEKQAILDAEAAMATHVYQHLVRSAAQPCPGVRRYTQPLQDLSGDLVLSAVGPKGDVYAMLGDFTGHGLPAALGALPTASIFPAMARKGLPLEVIAEEINGKLSDLLPTGHFCCAAFARLSADHRTLTLLNAGLPDVLLVRAGSHAIEAFPSRSIPLGIQSTWVAADCVEHVEVAPADALYIYSDGVYEARNPDSVQWGRDNLLSTLRDSPAADRLASVVAAVTRYIGGAAQSDDLTMLELVVSATPAADRERRPVRLVGGAATDTPLRSTQLD